MSKIKDAYNKISASDEVKDKVATRAVLARIESADSKPKASPARASLFSRIGLAVSILATKINKGISSLSTKKVWARAVAVALVFMLSLQPLVIYGIVNKNKDDGGSDILPPKFTQNTIYDNGDNPLGLTVGGGIVDTSFVDLSPAIAQPYTMDEQEYAEFIGSFNYNEWPITDGDDDMPTSPSEGIDREDYYAQTNTQHEGVDEGDIIKVDNNYIYNLTLEGLTIVDISGEEMVVASKIIFENFYPDEMYIYGDKLIIIGGEYSQMVYTQDDVSDFVCIEPVFDYRTNTRVIVYSVADRYNPQKYCEYTASGYFATSRLVGNKLIWATTGYVYNNQTAPAINDLPISAIDAYFYQSDEIANFINNQFIVLATLNLDSLFANATAHFGLNGTMYFNANNLYIFNTEYKNFNSIDYTASKYVTVIVKISLSSLLYCGSAIVDGYVSNRYWADEYEGNLRLVSYSEEYANDALRRYSNVYVLDSNLVGLGRISDIAEGERIYSVRFNGLEGSIVTYLTIDPLFKLDLSDPSNPLISKGLKEDGVSDYLQYLSDDYILGLGRGANLVGLKVSLYDNSGEDAVNINTINISGASYCEALHNPKAILNDVAKNMFSFTVAEYFYYSDFGWYSYNIKQGLYVFEYDLDATDDEDKLVFRGVLGTIKNGKFNDWEEYVDASYEFVKRGARIGGKIYTISDRYVISYDLDTLEVVQQLQISDISFSW